MKLSPLILGAAALVPIAGAAIGANLNTTPVGAIEDATASIPQQALFTPTKDPYSSQARLPDHYAMETPQGRVEVSELAIRGLYAARVRQAQHVQPVYRSIEPDDYWRETKYSVPAYEGSSETALLDAQQPQLAASDNQVERAAPAKSQMAASPASAAPATPQLTHIAVVQEVRSHAKSIDVEAQLSLQ